MHGRRGAIDLALPQRFDTQANENRYLAGAESPAVNLARGTAARREQVQRNANVAMSINVTTMHE